MGNLRKFLNAFTAYFRSPKISPNACKTKYPIILVHGIMYRDDMAISSWGRVPDHLRRGGAQVFLSNVDAWASYKHNGELLKKRIEEVLAETNSEKVNLIAHSKGGIDSRYTISKLGMENKVASLTTVCTPHHGCSMADIINKLIPEEENILYKITNLFTKLMGDHAPNSCKSVEELTHVHMKKFNEEVPNAAGVYYQSYGSHIFSAINDPVFTVSYTIVKNREGDNDGVVAETSCQWGEFRGIIEGKIKGIGISHLQMTGSVMDIISGVHIPHLYATWVEELKNKGF